MTSAAVRLNTRTLGDLFRLKHGYAFKGEFFSDSGPYILLTPGNFKEDGGLKLKGDREKYYIGPVSAEFLLKRGDLLVVMTDLTQQAPILDAPAFISEDNRYLHNQRLGKIVDLNAQEIDRAFLYYLLNLKRVRDQIKATASGATVRHTSPDRIYAVQVAIPPLPTQRKIAALLSAYDDLIANNTRRIAILEQMAQALYREWFVHFRFPGHEHARMVDSPLGPIPDGWQVVRLGDVADLIRRGIEPSRFGSETFAHYSIPAYDEGRLPATELGETIRSNKYLVPEDAVLISKINPRIPRVWLPFVAHYERAIASTEFLTLVPRPGCSREYLYALCSSEEFLGDLAGRAGGTSTSHQRVKPEDFMNLPVLLPTPPIARAFTEIVSALYLSQHNMRVRSTKLRCTRDLLLPKLVSGEIDVEAIEICA